MIDRNDTDISGYAYGNAELSNAYGYLLRVVSGLICS
jgi:hypothetical protein